MTNLLEVAIGLVFVYLILSLIVSAINEGIVGLTGRRAAFLEKGLVSVLGPALKEKFYGHGLVEGLRQQGVKFNKKPSYVKASTFVAVVSDLVGQVEMPKADPNQTAPAPISSDVVVDSFARGVERLTKDLDNGCSGPFAGAMKALSRQAKDMDGLRKSIEGWYDESMERVSGWYKRRTRAILFLLGFGLVAAVNADTLNIVDTLWGNSDIRESVVAAATQHVDSQDTAEDAAQTVASAIDGLEELQLPLGWAPANDLSDPRRTPSGWEEWAAKLGGLFVTAVALTFGAPFWFDLLKKAVGLRSSGSLPTTPTTPAVTPAADAEP